MNTKHTSARELFDKFYSRAEIKANEIGWEVIGEAEQELLTQLQSLLDKELIGEDETYEGHIMDWAIEHRNHLRQEQRQISKKLFTRGDE